MVSQSRHDYTHWVEKELTGNNNAHQRDAILSDSVAVGSKVFIEEIKECLGSRAIGRTIISKGENFILRESRIPYNTVFAPPKESSKHEKHIFLERLW